MKSDFTPQHRQTECWMVLEKVLLEELTAMRAANDADLTERETQTLRGKIKGIRFVLSLGKERLLLESDNNSLGF